MSDATIENVALAITTLIQTNLGYEIVEKPSQTRNGAVNVIDCAKRFAIVTCTEDDKPYVEAMVEMAGCKDKCKLVVKQKGQRVPAGKGFGEKVWRTNNAHAGIELSFEKRPSEEMRNKLKTHGFRWSRVSGVWYVSLKKAADLNVADFLVAEGFTKVEGV